ncbi:MAG: PASTA domain-containing protein [Acidobacteria bacterium]|nr:PASTA domain-containing protein [Acidobacteriota bacterium]
MMDTVACDRKLPPRWRSSVAVFEYEPPEDQQRTDDFRVTYLKVSCTMTGFQQDEREIRIRERLGRSGWTDADLTDRLGEAAAQYYACHGAMLEVVVAPHPDDKRFTLNTYPYFADFDPKKRELYEVVTETGEVMSRSLEDVNVRLGQTTLQSHEVRDKTTLAASLSGSYAGVTLAGSVANESGTTDLTQQGTENIRTSDAAREARETFSHTTQLSQMYHQLDSYHLGTNRAVFLMLPRPHSVQSPSTFVNGPREIEGVQEFMLVVVRPKEMEDFCVEAYLETAHLTAKPIPDWGRTVTQLPLHISTPDTNRVSGSNTSTKQTGYVVDTDLGGLLGGDTHGPGKGYSVTSENIGPWNGDYKFTVGPDTVTVDGWVEGVHLSHPPETLGCTMDVNTSVYLKLKIPKVAGYEPGLIITGRAVCSCRNRLVVTSEFKGASLVYEKALSGALMQETSRRESMTIRDANKLGADLKREMLRSLSSADRYPRDTVSLLDSQLIADMMGTHIRHADRTVNPRVMDWIGVDKKVARRVTAFAPAITRSQMLEMPLAQQVERFALSFDDAVKLRQALADLAEPTGTPSLPERVPVEVPLLTGLQYNKAQGVLEAVGLFLGSKTVIDSPMPSNTVIRQHPKSGTSVETATEVTVELASGCSVRLPEVIGLPFSEAVCLIRGAGLRIEPSVEGRPGPDAQVAALDPKAGTLVTPNTRVTIKLKPRTGTAPR